MTTIIELNANELNINLIENGFNGGVKMRLISFTPEAFEQFYEWRYRQKDSK